ncbi:XPG domain containing-domain-containing protein [Hypoxylon sp. FL0543]|nr:XPG domain containing-domain-containing protein [Hypoxylon sp. FL0543]
MGIPGFSRAIQRYGAFSPLSGESVVIDGPALVHRISETCLRQRPSSSGFVCHPPYSLLSRMVMIWLDELKSHDVKVRRIYFDGYLPPSKWEVRRERLLNQSQYMKALVCSEPFGSCRTPENAFGNLITDMTFTRLIGQSPSNTLPKPPFMVPAVLEALKNSEDWGPLVLVVPGEADMFCAQDVRENGGTLLTSDSDLLIQDLGLRGNVSFFWDVVPADPMVRQLGMMACKMSFHDINDRLGLTNIGGLPRVAFEKLKGRMGFDMALQKARDSREDTLNSLEYRTFIEELELKEYIPSYHPVLGILSGLDPRISEVVVQTLLLENGSGSSASDTKQLRGPETLSIFLPILVENRDKRSAWTVSTNVRQIAYSVLQNLAHQRSGTIVEYRTLDSSTSLTGRQIEIPDLEETISNCAQQVAALRQIAESFPSLDIQWLAFAIYQDVEWSSSEERSPLSAVLTNKSLNQPEDPDEYSWDLIHFTAQVQACLYSLRIEKQILDVVSFMGQDLPMPVQELRDSLASLPLIAEWPTVERMFNLLSQFGHAKGLTKIASMLGISGVKVVNPSAGSTRSKKRQKKDQEQLPFKRRQRDVKKSPSINPFAVLSQASED